MATKVKYGDSYIYIDDEPVDRKETGVFIEEDLEKTKEIKPINVVNLEDTMEFNPITDKELLGEDNNE